MLPTAVSPHLISSAADQQIKRRAFPDPIFLLKWAALESSHVAASPYLAEQIHTLTITKGADGKDGVKTESNLIVHAVVGMQVGKNLPENDTL